eukprot:CAMPEP_0176211288 /NCGR_PEP_ID=MMETSP0121_2-20121125/14576_1 /TAXON_ID=160619 /ORGANISM="Kryptoperidinium foliaceum, Strain CCMP 1326" /LENGTH=435 /DNA_ID=CAMNT_0017550335 /DNA_START=87 /DNA_END=1394 /DNA_ORIENTATION=+
MTTAAPPVPRTVLIYSHSWLPGQVDGVAVRIMAHAKSMANRGVKVVVATPDFVAPGKSDTPPVPSPLPGVEHHLLETMWMPVYKKNFCMRYSLANLRKLVDLIRTVRPDYVHGTQEAAMHVLATACLLCKVPLVISFHTDTTQIAARDTCVSSALGKWVVTELANWGYRMWSLSGAVFFPVSKQARAVLKNAGVREKYISPETWGPMVDRELFCVDKPEEEVARARKELTFGIPNAFLMVYVGRVTAEKDIGFLVKAMERGPENTVLVLVGPGSLTEELKKLHGPEKRIHCTGEFVSRENVAIYLRAADCCVSASVMETVGFTAMESLSCGTPMLAANAQGFAEHLSHGVNARLWTPHDEASFDKELAILMETPRTGNWSPEALRASMSGASVDICTDRALAAYADSGRSDKRIFRLALTLGFFAVNLIIFMVAK